MFIYISEQDGIKLFCWGYVAHDNYDGRWYGNVNIPIGFEEDEISLLKKYVANAYRIKEIRHNFDLSNDEFFNLLGIYYEESKIRERLKYYPDF